MNSIVFCEKKFSINVPVILWNDKNGFNGYNTSKIVTEHENRKTGKITKKVISGKRYSRRFVTRKDLTKNITQLFLHHDGLYRSRDTFNVLHNQRGLSVHFLLDDNGVLFQTLDIKEKAWHGGKNNPISIGIEIANRANAKRFPDAYNAYYKRKFKVSKRNKIVDNVHGNNILGYGYTMAQYISLINLGITLSKIFPALYLADFPRRDGKIIKSVISNPTKHEGYICHYNINRSKWDPISFDHERFINGVKNVNPYQGPTYEVTSWKEIQLSLNNIGYNVGPIDGIFGPKTAAALLKYKNNYMYSTLEDAKKSLRSK